jgi:NAD+ synthase (glutamine-hydrolysing)
MDSALVLTLAKMAAQTMPGGAEVKAIYMPGFFSQELSYQLSQQLCQKLNIGLQFLPIKFLHSTCKNTLRDHLKIDLQGLADENIQSRLRGLMLFAVANAQNAMVLNTSNKSELAVGYSTLYGDSVGAISLIGDLYKTYVYQLADFINRTAPYGYSIPEGIISRAPSAELRDQQKDSDSLPEYDELDALLSALIDEEMERSAILKKYPQTKPETLQKVYQLYFQSEFKRQQFPPIIKLFPKSFGFGHRLPIGKGHYTKA